MAARIRQPRIFHLRNNHFDELSDEDLIKRYRVDRAAILFILSLIENLIQPATNRNQSVSALTKVLVTLRFLATGKYQQCSAVEFGLSQPTVCKIISEVLDAITRPEIVKQFVNFPQSIDEVRLNQREFFAVSRFPGVVGVIDGTHIQIQAPSANEYEFVNRHNYHSINVQLVFDAKEEVIDVVANWPGSTHDSRIFRESGLRLLFEHNLIPGNAHLLGDSGYACKRYLLTPFLRPTPGHQENYNRAHKKTRSTVERGIGQLKRRWGVLHGEIKMAPTKACKIIIACCILHNICKQRRIPMIFDDPHGHPGQPHVIVDDGHGQPVPGGDGMAYRNYIANTYF